MKRANRKSIIGGMMALSLILTGTGYAYWTDSLNVTTKATTGELEVSFVDLGLYGQYNDELGWSIVDGIQRETNPGFIPKENFERGTDNYNIIAQEGSIDEYKQENRQYHNIDFDAKLVEAEQLGSRAKAAYKQDTLGSDKIEITVDNVYPGYAQAFRSDIMNLGTIAAKLSDIQITAKADGDKTLQKDMLGVAVLVNREEYMPGNEEQNTFKLCKEFANGDNFFTIGGVDFLRLSAIEEMGENEVRTMLENNVLYAQPGNDNRLDIFLAIGMDPDAEGKYTTGSTAALQKNDDKASQNNGAVITIDMLWDQFNVGVDGGSANILGDQNHAAE